jgi:alpha-galactosidase
MLLFPEKVYLPGVTVLVLDEASDPDMLPVVRWVGPSAVEPRPLAGMSIGSPMLVEHARPSYARPGLRGHRLASPLAGDGRDIAGRNWSTSFRPRAISTGDRLAIDADDSAAGLRLRTEIESLPGGALRARHVLTNSGATPYLLDALEITVPIPDTFNEVMDFTGRHERERIPQRQPIRDGIWTQESRHGKPGLDSASIMLAGTAGFGFDAGEVIGVHVGSSGNSTMSLHRSGSSGPTLSAGELLLPGEVVLMPGTSYSMPWVYVVAARDGLDAIAAALHQWQRTLPAHPDVQPVTLNVWEAIYFDHSLPKLRTLADLAAGVGVERFVLDDGWFRGRRHERAGLGDWWVDEQVWPDGLYPLIEHVHNLGMQFGLWIEPEMVNPDSDLFRAHPHWILSSGGRTPVLHRNQLVLDLTDDDVWTYLRDRIDDLLSTHAIDYIKWDHNRDLLEAGSTRHGGAPSVNRQYLAHYALLDDLAARHPNVAWESCAAGGGRIDLGVLERVQRVWTSDMTDALARQQIQRWTAQFVAPEYLGAHVSAPTSHQTGRTLDLDFRAATAMFGSFGIEWDLTEASLDDLGRLREWSQRYKEYRPLLHSGRMRRLETSDPAVLAHAVIADDAAAALVAHVQLDESAHNRGVIIRVLGLDPDLDYELIWASPIDHSKMSAAPPLDPDGPTGGVPVSGAFLAQVGIWLPRRRPEAIQLIALTSRG